MRKKIFGIQQIGIGADAVRAMSSVGDVTGPLRWLARSSTLRLTLLLSGVFAIGMAVAIVLALWFGRDAVLRRVDTTLVELAASVSDDDVPSGSSVLVRPLDELGGLPAAFAQVARAVAEQ
jgi:hypothetical protein